MRACSLIVSGLLPDDRVNESRIDAFAFTNFKDDPIQVLVAGGRNVGWYLELSRTSGSHRGHHMAEHDAGHVSENEEGKNGEWRKLQGTKMRILTGKLHPEQSPGFTKPRVNILSGAATQMVHCKPAVAFLLRIFHL
jgi:hypothetical protein